MLRLLLHTLAALATFTGDAHGDPLTAGVVAAIGLTGTAATIATAVLNFTISSVLSSALTKALAPKQRSAVAAAQADATTVSIGEGPAQVVLGRALVGGTLVDAFNWGATNEWETQVICLADHEIDALEGVMVNDTFVPFTGDGFLPGFLDGARECLQIDFRNGTFPASSPPPVCIQYSDWTGDDFMHGRTYVAMSYFFSRNVFPQGRPRFAFVLRGAKLYDPRLDSTVAGGAGAQRYADPSTWTWSDNGALIVANYAWGIRTRGFDGASHLMAGPGRSLAEEPPEDVIARANLADEDVGLKAGGTEKRWRLTAVINADQKWRTVLEDLAASMAGDLVSRRGLLTVEPGAARAAAATFTDDRLILGETTRFTAFQPRDRAVNTVVARYVEPAQFWKQASAPTRRSLDDIAADGEPRELTLDLKHCPSGTQAQRVAEIARRRARLERTATVTLGPRLMGLEAGDWLPWQSARRFAGETVMFEVTSAADGEKYGGASGRITVTLAETAASCWTWNPAIDELDRTPASLPASPRDPLAIAGFAIEAATEMTGAATAPVIAVSWTPVTDPACTEIRAEFRRTGTTAVETRVFAVPAAGAEILRGAFDHDQSYDVRLVPVVTGARRSSPTAWLTVVTDALVLLDVTGLAATARADGVTLSWSPATQPEVTGFDVRRSLDAVVAWEAATVVQTGFAGTALDVALADAAPVTFLVRARDRQGRLSPVAARITTQVTAPGDVTSFEAAPNGEVVRFTWGEVAGAASYEIRAGVSWEAGRVVDRPSGFSTSVLWPIMVEEDAIFFIKAVSAARLYSAVARIVYARTAPVQTRNVVYEKDYVSDGWPGVRHDFSIDGSLLTLDASGGVSLPFGDYYDEIPLARSFYARAWINTRAAAVVDDSPTWDSLDVDWDDLSEATWEPPLGDAGSARLSAYIAPKLLTLPDTLVEGWRLKTNDTGVNATAAAVSVGVTRGPCWRAAGAAVGPGVALGWTKTLGPQFSLLFDVAPVGAQSGDAAILTLANAAGDWLQVWRRVSDNTLRATTSAGATVTLAVPFAEGDPLTVAVSQDATTLRLYAATRRTPTIRQGSAASASPATWTKLYVGGPAAGDELEWDDADFDWDSAQGDQPWDATFEPVGGVVAGAPCTIGEVEAHDTAVVASAFPSTWELRGPVGYEPFRTFAPGDYRIEGAGVWLHLEAPDPVAHTLAIPLGEVFVDVPDVIDRQLVTITSTVADTTVALTRPFYEAPEVVAEWRGGATIASPRVVAVTESAVTLRLVAVSDFTTRVAGDVSLVIAGY